MNRLEQLLRAIARAGALTGSSISIQSVAERAGVTRRILSASYGNRKSETVTRILEAIAELTEIDAGQLRAWIEGRDVPEIDELVGMWSGLNRCLECRDWVPEAEFIRTRRRCKTCLRAPATREWVDRVDKLIVNAPKRLQNAWQRARADDKESAVSYVTLAELLGIDVESLKHAWEEAGLPRRPVGRRARVNITTSWARSRRHAIQAATRAGRSIQYHEFRRSVDAARETARVANDSTPVAHAA